MSTKYSWEIVDHSGSNPDFVEPTSSPIILTDISGGDSYLGANEGFYNIDLGGKTFNFYGINYTNAVLSANGFLTFNGNLELNTATGYYGNVEYFIENGIDGIFVFDDLFKPDAGNIYIENINNRLICTFHATNELDNISTDLSTFQIQLELNTGSNFGKIYLIFKEINFNYTDEENFYPATYIGLLPNNLTLESDEYLEYQTYKDNIDFTTNSTNEYYLPIQKYDSVDNTFDYKTIIFYQKISTSSITNNLNNLWILPLEPRLEICTTINSMNISEQLKKSNQTRVRFINTFRI
jgi:hypothetical protein